MMWLEAIPKSTQRSYIIDWLTLFRMGDRIYADRMGEGVKNSPPPPTLTVELKELESWFFFMEVPTVMYFPKNI